MTTPERHWPWLLRWALPLAGLTAGAWHGAALGRAVMRGRALASQAQAFEAHPQRAHARVLFLGDSTGVGVGCNAGVDSLSGLLAAEFPQVEILNACCNGARVVDTLRQLRAHAGNARPFDLVLVMAGGNDVLKMTSPSVLASQAQALLRELRPQARHVVWMGSADIGNAPALMAPLNWAFGWLCRRTMKRLGQVVTAEGAEFIDFCGQHHSRIFSSQPEHYFADDGLHPSAASYRHCFAELSRRAPLVDMLGRLQVAP